MHSFRPWLAPPRSAAAALALPVLLAACAQEGPSIRNLTPEISVVPTAEQGLAFGEVIVSQSGIVELYVANAGRAGLDTTVELTGDAVFSLPDEYSGEFEVGVDETEAIPVTFTPDNFLDYTAEITITSNDEESPQIVIPVSGVGVDAPMPDIDVSPQTIDFGVVPEGNQFTEFLTITNTGEADLTLGSVTQEGSPGFLLQTDPSGQVIAPGSEVPVVIQYAPLNDAGDNGSLTIPSDDPDEPELVVDLLGNGGGDFEYPVAVIDCPLNVFITGPEYVTLDGSASSDPDGQALTYTWELVRAPDGSSSELSLIDTEQDSVPVFIDLAGVYEVQLTVTNEQDTPSVPTKCEMVAIPEDNIRVELIWDGPTSDLDLHLGETRDVELFDPGDANWCNESPDWGDNGSDDDPRLDIDDRGGYGPENINLLDPVDGEYPVRVHYFEDNNDDLVTATVTVWSKEFELWSGSKVMARDEVWDVGQINWPEATFAEFDTPLYDAPRRSCP